LWLAASDGSGRRRLTQSGEDFDFDPDWSPDGTRIIFRTDLAVGEAEGISVVGADGFAERLLFEGGSFARWSPDGSRIAFSAIDMQLAVGDPDGSDVTLLGVRGECAVWSPDGSRIAYCAQAETDDGPRWAVWVVNADGSEPRRLTTHPGDHYPRGWSPDGRTIVFWTQGSGKLFGMRPDGSGQRRLTRLRWSSEVLAGWLPDGRMLVGIESEDEGITAGSPSTAAAAVSRCSRPSAMSAAARASSTGGSESDALPPLH
jgi:Tol biopolymer transport system component